MDEGPDGHGSGYASRSELNRCLLAAGFAALVFATIAHAASYFGLVIVRSPILQNALSWGLVTIAAWVLLGNSVRSEKIPGWLPITIWLVWLYYIILLAFSPGAVQLSGRGVTVAHARSSSAFQVAAAFTSFLILWFQPSAPGQLKGSLQNLIPAKRADRLAMYGFGIPTGILVICGLAREILGDRGLINWAIIVTVLWWIGTAITVGIVLIRSALRPDV